MKTAAAYIRVSTEDQVEYSPDAQLRELKEYALAHDLLLDPTYIYTDEGISGRRAEKRPGFLRMISDAKSSSHPFDVILVHKYDRFARSREDSIVYKSMLRKAGVEVVSIKEPLSDGAYSGVMEAIYESFAEAYSINLGQEVKKGMTEKALRGEPLSIPPFGYRLENKKLVPVQDEAELVKSIFKKFVGGEGCYPLARWCNSQGYRTHRGSIFENRTVEYIIRNPTYCGYIRWNPKRKTKRHFADPDLLIVKGNHEPLVTKELWDEANLRLDHQKRAHPYRSRPSSERKHWLCGIVRCPTCNSTLIWSNPNYFKCNNYVRGSCTTSQHISSNLLESAFISRLTTDLESTSDLTYTTIRSSASASSEKLAAQAVQKIRRKISRLTEAYLDESIDLDTYRHLKLSLDADLSAANTSLSKCTAVPASDSTALRNQLRTVLSTITSPDIPIPQKYDALLSIIDTCYFDKSQMLLTITYRLIL